MYVCVCGCVYIYIYIYESIITSRQLSDHPSSHKHPNKSLGGYKIKKLTYTIPILPTLQFTVHNYSHLRVQKSGTAGFVLGGKAKGFVEHN
jgi:hypothetical protein